MLNCNAVLFPIVLWPIVALIRSGLRRLSLGSSSLTEFPTLRRNCYIAFLPAPSVTFAMTTGTKRNQVLHHVAAELAPTFHVMDLQPFHGTALLAPPAISLQNLDSEFLVLFRAQFKPGLLLT
jgi:hypothetical protein